MFSAMSVSPEPAYLQLPERRHHELPVAVEVGARVPHEKELPQVDVAPEGLHAAQLPDEIYCQVKFRQPLTSW